MEVPTDSEVRWTASWRRRGRREPFHLFDVEVGDVVQTSVDGEELVVRAWRGRFGPDADRQADGGEYRGSQGQPASTVGPADAGVPQASRRGGPCAATGTGRTLRCSRSRRAAGVRYGRRRTRPRLP